MGGVQKQRHTKGRRNRRRSQIMLSSVALTSCSKCGSAILPHRACAFCGFYKGKETLKIKIKTKKKR